LARAREALRFVHAMAVGDGTYYNFMFADGRINRGGRTSKPGLNWWTARALWATVEGMAVFAKPDPAFARVLRADAARTRAAIAEAVLPRVGRFETVGGAPMPAWLMGGAADVSAVAAIALAEWQSAAPNPRTAQLLAALAGGIAAYHRGSPGTYPYGAHLPSADPTLWHSYGAHMLHALALAGRVLKRPDFVRAARDEADHFTIRLVIAGGPLASFSPERQDYPQIAYGDETQTLGLLALYEATGDRRYGELAGVMASWLTGDNVARKPMYDPATGRVWDGLDAGAKVSEDSGAESTIEGLLTLLAIARHPELAPYVGATPVAWESGTDERLRLVRVIEGGKPFDLAIRENLTARPLRRDDTTIPPYGFTLVERPAVFRRP
ncbi:MAG TPA: hypothetical protein V6D47_04855, partial [Oscillatoriaceae cyanobacterium]